jgi:hypothetical protein
VGIASRLDCSQTKPKQSWAGLARTARKCPNALALAFLWATSGSACGAAIYDPGPLLFTTTDQSMWGTGDATVIANSVFVGPQWTNQTVGVGGFTGSRSTVTINTNPGWWAWKACKETINFACGDEPSKGQIKEVVDTRTGARVDLTTSGKFGLEFGYTVNSGSVDAIATMAASAVLPAVNPGTGQYFSLNPDSKLAGGSLSSDSPWVEAHVDAIAQLSGSVTAKACLILAGCTPEGTLKLPGINLDQNVVAIDPNSLKILDGFLPPNNPGEPKQPLAEVKLANQSLTLQAAVSAEGVPGFKLTTPQFTLLNTLPPGPDVSIDLASIEFKLPNISTDGGKDGTNLTSSGRDDVITLRADVDGLAFLAGAGSIPPLGIGFDLIDSGGFKVGMQLDALDIDMGPDIGITQDFELKPTLMVHLDFDHPVMVAGYADPQSFWEGEWDMLPDIALLQNTTITPTFSLMAMLTNNIGIDLGLTGNWDIYKFSFTAAAGGVTILGTNPVSLNTLLGLGNTMFSTNKLEFPIWDSGPFALGGFDSILAAAFTINVPEPSPLALLLAALAAGALATRRSRIALRRRRGDTLLK